MTTRKLEDLLSLDSYQDMTDDEIELVIAFKVNTALKTEELKLKSEALEADLKARIEIERDYQTKVYDLFAEQLKIKPELQVIGYEQKE